MERAGLSLRGPFKDKNVWQIQDGVRLLTGRLKAAGQIQAQYSAHDLRHAFAVRVYTATRDVYETKKALGHASVTVTETYLRSLGVKEETA
jgi:integrase